ncbi:MAG: 23S rRNA (guanosine(2251)-2'-O)-methyltransferase RlmB [Acidobacteria bacterium]|nr:23S rRNA (guanosine(2251)-2'-O)-methyltransferase RlmB [Acidobacteriota bacterium]
MERIEGRNPVREALRAGRPIRRILISKEAAPRGALAEIVALAREAGVRVDRVPRAAISEHSSGTAPQGVIAEVDEYRYRSWREGLAGAGERGEPPMFLALDRVTDPRNLGSLLRSAEVFGCHAVLLPSRRSAPITAVAEKAAAGATGHLVIDRVDSLERALAACRKAGLWVVGLDASAEASIDSVELLGEPVALVVGSEGTGLSRLVSERADALARVPMAGRLGSLGVAVAGAIALYEARRRRSGVE